MAVRAGLQRGRIEFRQYATSGQDIWSALFTPVVSLIVMYVLRDSTVPGTDFSLGTQSVPGILGLNVVLTGLVGLAMALAMDREDGTVLRAKATPNGVPGYLTGKVVSRAAVTVVSLFVALVPAAFLFDGMELGGAASWLTLAWVLALGLAATLPLGAMAGALAGSVQSLGFVWLLMMGLVGVSGVFYPVTALPGWLQLVAQVFPVYWLGLGLRSALLPDALAAAEAGDSWRHLETAGVLGVWAVVGLLTAPAVLRRMARRESGAAVAAGREKALQRQV
ncbi:ABC transporter permease [Streptomyces armeniacus]|uniref:Transport permease protein n=1 Tax=Streptomyces armeniacus TaxID=83291 RepID=A0A345Y016_9ACTN|nr:ABC transporter permease [Streptomyces armeniacus]